MLRWYFGPIVKEDKTVADTCGNAKGQGVQREPTVITGMEGTLCEHSLKVLGLMLQKPTWREDDGKLTQSCKVQAE